MAGYRWTALVSLLALCVYFWMVMQVGGARRASGIKAPAMTGDARLERAVRVQMNTLEWMPIFFVGLWLFAVYWDARVAAGLGVVWMAGRVVYALGYMADPGKRSTGFLVQFFACVVLVLGALGRVVWGLASAG